MVSLTQTFAATSKAADYPRALVAPDWAHRPSRWCDCGCTGGVAGWRWGGRERLTSCSTPWGQWGQMRPWVVARPGHCRMGGRLTPVRKKKQQQHPTNNNASSRIKSGTGAILPSIRQGLRFFAPPCDWSEGHRGRGSQRVLGPAPGGKGKAELIRIFFRKLCFFLVGFASLSYEGA